MKLSKKGRVLTLGRADTKTWEDSGPQGDKFRRRIRQLAQAQATKIRASVEIYASASAGGWMADQFFPEKEDGS